MFDIYMLYKVRPWNKNCSKLENLARNYNENMYMIISVEIFFCVIKSYFLHRVSTTFRLHIYWHQSLEYFPIKLKFTSGCKLAEANLFGFFHP